MKIVTWNVNGVRAALNKRSADWWNAQDLDVLCLQEIKARPDQLTEKQHVLFGEVVLSCLNQKRIAAVTDVMA